MANPTRDFCLVLGLYNPYQLLVLRPYGNQIILGEVVKVTFQRVLLEARVRKI